MLYPFTSLLKYGYKGIYHSISVRTDYLNYLAGSTPNTVDVARVAYSLALLS